LFNNSFIKNKQSTENKTKNQKSYDEIEITPDFISYLLNEVDAWKLHKNPLNMEDPIINIKIEEKEFYSTIGTGIETLEGSSNSADLELIIDKNDLIDAIISEEPKDVLSESISSKRSSVEIIAPESELFAKGYLDFYNTLKR
jgi:hypothetical protein